MLTSLPYATVSISHEQVEGMYFDRVDALKAAITADPVLINVKHKSAFTYKPYVVVIFCTNSWPKVKDDTGAWQRRLLIMQFLHDYRGKKEKPYIKQRYLKDERVIEYVLSKVLEQYSDRTEFTLFPYLEENLKEYKDKTRPVDMFMKEYAAQFKWKFIPFTFLYDCFTTWYEKTYNKKCGIGCPTFINDIAVWCLESDPEKQFKPTVNDKGTVQRVCCKKEYTDSFENQEEPIIYTLCLDKEFPDKYELKGRTHGYLKNIPKNVSGLLRIKDVDPDKDVIKDF
jgi:phage/plasmid-associated DNA primase